jgi:hypothetical protein
MTPIHSISSSPTLVPPPTAAVPDSKMVTQDGDAAAFQAAAAPDRGAQSADPPAGQDAVSALFERPRSRLVELIERDQTFRIEAGENGWGPDHPEVLKFTREQQQDLLMLQLDMQSAQFRVEFATRIVDHGASAAKSVLQTQL